MDGLSIGEVASEAAVHVETLRYYERKGLVPKPPRTASNYRLYPSETVARVRFIKHAQDLGFTLREISELLALRSTRGAKASDVRRKAEAKLQDIEEKLEALKAMRATLKTLIGGCSGKGPATTCTILAALDGEGESK